MGDTDSLPRSVPPSLLPPAAAAAAAAGAGGGLRSRASREGDAWRGLTPRLVLVRRAAADVAKRDGVRVDLVSFGRPAIIIIVARRSNNSFSCCHRLSSNGGRCGCAGRPSLPTTGPTRILTGSRSSSSSSSSRLQLKFCSLMAPPHEQCQMIRRWEFHHHFLHRRDQPPRDEDCRSRRGPARRGRPPTRLPFVVFVVGVAAVGGGLSLASASGWSRSTAAVQHEMCDLLMATSFSKDFAGRRGNRESFFRMTTA